MALMMARTGSCQHVITDTELPTSIFRAHPHHAQARASFVTHHMPPRHNSISRAPSMTAVLATLHPRICGSPFRQGSVPWQSPRVPTPTSAQTSKRRTIASLHAYLGDESIVRLDEGYQLPTANPSGPMASFLLRWWGRDHQAMSMRGRATTW